MRASITFERALESGDVDAARAALDDPDGWPNVVDPYLGDTVLSRALGCAPLEAIRKLLADGADPNFRPQDDGFPSLIDVIHHRRSDRPELRKFDDAHELLRMLIAAGADVEARGLNDGTALHFACWYDDAEAVRILLDAGADPQARTRIDDLETPAEIAEANGGNALRALDEWRSRSHPG